MGPSLAHAVDDVILLVHLLMGWDQSVAGDPARAPLEGDELPLGFQQNGVKGCKGEKKKR